MRLSLIPREKCMKSRAELLQAGTAEGGEALLFHPEKLRHLVVEEALAGAVGLDPPAAKD